MWRSGVRRLNHLPLPVSRFHGQPKTPFPSHLLLRPRFLDIFQMANKEAVEKERARIKDEMSRGYFADMAELKQHGGKIAMANEALIPAMEAVKFPALSVQFSDGRKLQLPHGFDKEDNSNSSVPPSACLVCLSFRANSQTMIESWTTPFLDALNVSKDVLIYEVSLIDSWFLSLAPIKFMLLKIMRKSDTCQRNVVYSFGDNYYFRKELKILNLLTGYLFLLDKFGRIRWQGFGRATSEELASLISCASDLSREK